MIRAQDLGPLPLSLSLAWLTFHLPALCIMRFPFPPALPLLCALPTASPNDVHQLGKRVERHRRLRDLQQGRRQQMSQQLWTERGGQMHVK